MNFDSVIPTGIYAGKTWRQKFNECVVKSDSCWLWSGSLYSNGYGRFGVSTRGLLAHRVAVALADIDVPEGSLVCHRCDVRHCVRPDHLFVGTHKDNMQDMHRKGRANPACGERNWRAKLSDAQVSELRSMRAAGLLHKDLARHFGVSRKQVSVICSGKQRTRLSNGEPT